MGRMRALAVLALAVILGAAGSLQIVSQRSRNFSQREISVGQGETVRFSNEDEFLHQIYVTSATFNYESAEQEPGKTVDVRFPVSGTFKVRCEIHPKMALTVTVR